MNLKGKAHEHESGFCLDDEFWRSYEQKIHSVMVQGFTDRAKFIRVIWRNTASDLNLEDV